MYHSLSPQTLTLVNLVQDFPALQVSRSFLLNNHLAQTNPKPPPLPSKQHPMFSSLHTPTTTQEAVMSLSHSVNAPFSPNSTQTSLALHERSPQQALIRPSLPERSTFISKDPYFWTIEQLVYELCYNPDPAWISHAKEELMPSSDILEQRLRENVLDGESFMSMEMNDVAHELGFTAFGVRRIVHKVVKFFRGISLEHKGQHMPIL
jgi:hypothetical protein